MNRIRKIPDSIIHQIAAGEIVERPSSIIKELIENSIDAEARNIEIQLIESGKAFISVKDDGHGISKEDLPLSIEPHTTSKLDSDYNLWNINSFGFRGEALAAISNVSKFAISSQPKSQNTANKLVYENGKKFEINPTKSMNGTLVEIRDLFFSIPARLKFLKNNNTELMHCIKIIKALAICHHNITFKVFSDNKLELFYPNTDSLQERFQQVLGNQSLGNLFTLEEIIGSYQISAITSIPNFNKPNSNYIFTFVNQRYIKDFIINKTIKDAYSDLIPHTNYPVTAIFLTVPMKDVDVNVHPAKTEIKFIDPFTVQKIIKSAFQKHLLLHAKKSNSSFANDLIEMGYQNSQVINQFIQHQQHIPNVPNASRYNFPKCNNSTNTLQINKNTTDNDNLMKSSEKLNLGQAIFQFANKYIFSTHDQLFFIIDQHAAHERIVYERMKKDFFNRKIESQLLISPHIIEFHPTEINLLIQTREYFEDVGLVFCKMDDTHLVIKALPAVLKHCDIDTLMEVVLEELKHWDSITLEDRIKSILATIACHNSIRAGKDMNLDEMNTLLRTMEELSNTGQCNHGRPSYCLLSIHDLDKLFERT